MSYILDALKKADAQREHDSAGVPDLHAQPDAATRSAGTTARGAGWRLPAFVALALLLAVLAWQWSATAPWPAPVPAAMSDPVPAPMPAVEPATRVAAANPVATAAPPPPAAATIVAGVTPTPATPALDAPGPPPPPPPAAPATRHTLPASPAATKTTAAAVARAPVGSASRPAAAASAGAAARLLALSELPADVRSRLPALAVGGSVYSPNAASRIVILNGQVFREGDHPVDGLTVEQIGLKSTVLSFRGYRIELKH